MKRTLSLLLIITTFIVLITTVALQPFLRAATAQGAEIQAPTELTLTASHKSIFLEWNTPDDQAATHHTIQRAGPIKEGAEAAFQTLTDNTGSPFTTYTDFTVQPNSTYAYKVAAVNEEDETSPFSTEARATSLQPDGSKQPDHIDLGDITYTPGIITPPPNEKSQDFRFELTTTALVNFTLRPQDQTQDDSELVEQEFEDGTYFLTFTLTNYANYTLHYVATPSSTEETDPVEPYTPQDPTDPPTTPEPEAPPAGTIVDLGDITDQTGTIAHDPDATAYTFRTTEDRQVTLLLNPNTKKGTSRYLLNYPLGPGFHITPYGGNENSSYTLEYDATGPPSEPDRITTRSRHCQIQMSTIHRGSLSANENTTFTAGTWSVWQSCQGGGGNRATYTVTASADPGTATLGTIQGRHVIRTGPTTSKNSHQPRFQSTYTSPTPTVTPAAEEETSPS